METRFHNDISIPVNGIRLRGELCIPIKASSIIVFSHGSGSSRMSPRNRQVAIYLQKRNFGTLLFDLLTPEEDHNYHNRFEIDLLRERLVEATIWLQNFPAARNTAIGFFGASTGAASALKAVIDLPYVYALVSRGGRPDLAMDDLPMVNVPTLLIVGSEDEQVLQYNRMAYQALNCEKNLEIVNGATHLFEEPGKMEIVSELATDWFSQHVPKASA
jgi:putative phosphoribosyl transferase